MIKFIFFHYFSSIILLHNRQGFQHISESVYFGLCSKLGTSQLVANLREIADFNDLIYRRISSKKRAKMLSGSTREGIRIKGSDLDFMF